MATQALRTLAGPLTAARVGAREAAVLNFATQMATVIWDFSVDGGAVGTFSFGTSLPANAVVTRVFADIQTAATSGGAATWKLAAGATDLLAAVAFNNATNGINAVGVQTVVNTAPAAGFEAIKLSSTTPSELAFVVAAAALTAGKVRFAVEFYVSK